MPTEQNTDTIKLDPRETWQGREHEATSFWLRGTRDRYGFALFVTAPRENKPAALWRNNMPFAPNKRIADVPDVNLTLAELDRIVEGI